jgi:ABC-type transport system involved in multi-copper enzyme maturation permease subunit
MTTTKTTTNSTTNSTTKTTPTSTTHPIGGLTAYSSAPTHTPRGVVFADTVMRGLRTMLFWGLAVGLMAFLQTIVVSDVQTLDQMASLLGTMPPALLQAFGGTSDLTFLATPEGYLALQFFGFFLLIIGSYSLLVGLNMTTADEDRGILDVVLSAPIGRGAYLLERLLGGVVLQLGMIAIVLVLFLTGLILTPTFEVDLGRMTAGTLNFIPAMLFMFAVAALAGVVFRRRGTASAFAWAFLVAGYMLDVIGRATEGSEIAAVRAISFFTYADSVGVIRSGLNWANIALLLVLAVGAAAAAVALFQRREIGR